jgi:ribosome biogenesis GTPase A
MIIHYEAETHAQALTRLFKNLLSSLEKPSWREATGESWLARLDQELDQVSARLRQPFTLLVLGDFKRGKSTLINALLGESLVTMDVAPETLAITELHQGPALKLEAILNDGGRIALKAEDLPGARLGPILENLPKPVDIIRIETPNTFLSGLCIVDSPGMGDLHWRFDRLVQSYLPKADAVLYVVSALSPLSETERNFLRLSLRPLELSKVIFVVNLIDQLKKAEDTERVLERIRSSLQPLFPDSSVLGLSALHELCRKTAEELPDPSRAEALDHAFAALKTALDRRVLVHRNVVRNERAVQEAEGCLKRASSELSRYLKTLEQDRSTLKDTLRQADQQSQRLKQAVLGREERLKNEILALGEETATWMDGLLSRIEHSLRETLYSASYEDIQRHFPFFLGELLRDGLGVCLDYHQGQILEKVEVLSQEAASELEHAFDTGLEKIIDPATGKASFHTPSWTVLDHLHTVAMLLPGISLLSGLLDFGTGQSIRGEQYRNKVIAAFPELRTQVLAASRKTYSELASTICQQLRSVQVAELESIASELKQAVAIHEKGQDRLNETTAGIRLVQAQLENTLISLAELKSTLHSAAQQLE